MTIKTRAALRIFVAILSLNIATPSAFADSWNYPSKRTEKVYAFDDTKIVLITDPKKSRKYPDFILRVYENGKLQSQVHNVWFEQVFRSPNKELFVGLSNRGIPGTAVVIFTKNGAITLLASHEIAKFDYCDESVTMVRRWYDENNPDVKFLPEKEAAGKTSGITLRDCHGQTVDLLDAVLLAYNKSFQGTAGKRGLPAAPELQR